MGGQATDLYAVVRGDVSDDRDQHGTEAIDSDGHIYESDSEIFEHLEGCYAGRRTVLGFPFWPTLDGFQRGAIHARLGIHESFQVDAGTWLDFLDATGIESTVLYPTAGLATGLIRDPDWAVAVTRAYNDWLAARYLARSPRLRGVALLPLQDPLEAARELRRAVRERGMVGGVLAPIGLERTLGHADFDPVYAEAERLDCPLAVHGGPAVGLGLDRLEPFAQVHTLSHPFAQMIQMTSILMGGVLDRFPRLRIAFLEAGVSWVPFLVDRMDRSYEGRMYPEYTGGCARRPSEYLMNGNVFFSCESGERLLAHVAELTGGERLLFASDFPHEVNLERCRREIAAFASHAELSEQQRIAVLAGNARRFYGLAAAR
ncbi:MAG: amidohydrolase [Deltaproteobacteria bacterium]|nr:amidohydrolase [Deltaproteobacteria bacterium]